MSEHDNIIFNQPVPLDEQKIVDLVRAQYPELQAVYLFGSYASGHATSESDIDLAVLVNGSLDKVELWYFAQNLAQELGPDVDLIDIRAATTVMQYQIITTGRLLWSKDAHTRSFESYAIISKYDLDIMRAPLINDILAGGTFMVSNDVLVNKSASIERCVKRVREEYYKNPDSFAKDLTRQDAVILNLQRACQLCIALGLHVLRNKNLGVPQLSREVFQKLATEGIIEEPLSKSLQQVVGFRNIAVHDYQNISLEIVISIITDHLDDLSRFAAVMLQRCRA